MKFDLRLHKTINSLSKIKMSSFTLFLAFLSSFNFWFICLYFFNNHFFIKNGIIITLMTTLIFTTAWFLISIITVPKDFILISFALNDYSGLEDIGKNNIINIFIFAEVILLHSFFAYLAYITKMSFFWLYTLAFFLNGLKYFLTDFLLKHEYSKFLEKQKNLKNIE